MPMTLDASGRLQGVSVALAWDAAVSVPDAVLSGDLVPSQGGIVLSPGPGRADAVLLGASAQGIGASGALATVRFRALKDGDPHVAVARVVGRDVANHDVAVTLHSPVSADHQVTATELEPVIPNPTRGAALVQYALAKRGPVRVAIYDVDGRLIRTLAQGEQEAGRYQVTWDGSDARGAALKSGMFFVRFEAAGVHRTRPVSVIR